jgi:hypothetical protein
VAAFIVPRSSVCAALGEACLLLTEMYQMISFGPVFTVFQQRVNDPQLCRPSAA